MPKILDGRKCREDLMPALIEKIGKIGFKPVLAIVQVADLPDATAFIRAKMNFASKMFVEVKHIKLPEKVSEEMLVRTIEVCNSDKGIHGIIVQLPLPAHIDRDRIIEAIDPAKDADGLTAVNVKKWLAGGNRKFIMPATARGVRELLKYYGIGLADKKVVILGRSMLVGKPLVAMCVNENATVTVCHRETRDIGEMTKKADIVISATGKVKLLKAENVNGSQIVVDVGISRTADGKLVGDVDFENVSNIVEAITPVPGGVGPMTVFSLFENLADLCSK